MYVNINAFGFDLDIKFRKRGHRVPKVLIAPTDVDGKFIEEIVQALG